MFAFTVLVPQRKKAMKIFNHFVVAMIGISNLESDDVLGSLRFEDISHCEQSSKKGLERTKMKERERVN